MVNMCRLTPGLPDTTQDAPLTFGVARRRLCWLLGNKTLAVCGERDGCLLRKSHRSRRQRGAKLVKLIVKLRLACSIEAFSDQTLVAGAKTVLAIDVAGGLAKDDFHVFLQCLWLRLFLKCKLSLSNPERMSSNLFIKYAEAC